MRAASVLWRTAAAAVLAVLAIGPSAAPARPPLVVLLVVDQLRTDYLDTFRPQWTGGLRRLLDEGAWFRRAAYPYLNTVTCAGHATIATGATPSVHGMVLNEWWDREAQRPVTCTHDPEAVVASHGEGAAVRHSSRRLLVPALADEMRVRITPAPRVVSLSMKARSALMMAGQGGDAVLWFENGSWTWPAGEANAAMPPIVDWLRAHPVDADRGRVWQRSLPRNRYLYADDPAGKQPLKGWGASLPHPLGDDGGFVTRWEHSPFADEYLARLAAAVVSRLDLGRRGTTDYLAVSFSALDRIGHKLGPRSHEVQDALVRLDGAIGGLLAHLDRHAGRGRYLVALSSDHGVSPVPEQVRGSGGDAGRLRGADIVARVEAAASQAFGPGKYVARHFYTDLYFAPGVYERLRARPDAMAAVLAALRSMPGIAAAYRGDELARGVHAADPLARAAAASYHPGRSGDLILVPKANWIISTAAATHGSANPYDTHVPVLLMGYGVRGGTYTAEATPADIAPTLGSLAGVTLPRATGRVLKEALISDAREGTPTAPHPSAAR